MAEEIRQVYCQTFDTQRHQLFLLAKTNGLMAARTLNLPICYRIESNGQTLILQKCQQQKIEMSMKETKCGFQPYFVTQDNKSYTIGKDGWSLQAFSDCFWTNQFVNLNDHAYSFIKGNWTRQLANIPLWKINLVDSFKNLPLTNLDFSFRHHPSHDTQSLEQLNVLTELISKLQETNSDSLSDLVMDVQSKSN